MIKKAKVGLWSGEFTWAVFKPKAGENKKPSNTEKLCNAK